MNLPGPPRRPGDTGSAADQEALRSAKEMLRGAIRTRRRARPEAARLADDHARFLLLQDFWGTPQPDSVVAAYLSHADEPGTLETVGWLTAHGVRVLLPVLDRRADGSVRREPDWAPYAGPDRLRAGLWGIPEPTTDPVGAEGLAEAGVIVCSGLAGTTAGERLGMGGGWFDRALEYAAADAVTVMPLNDDEVLPSLPVQPWDRRVDVLITPTRLVPPPD
ncbi:5-formyltetrahydrofolate cyclo-ligase [Enemella evansiae]|uniref:5-formyltetrahydrofolate cyclo-ligase n=1 Tax=Enemella evansiae TaxID=2016499 RepID=UPI000B965876|nr:5-formyltetrahydrofolate cyclo-ligase [Enemella evansiae]PFG66172.1 5-formyltetrahydrofolate cyclo-ligase [Propionibacteriaceae bacterium ES.041]OYN94977.1 5-formyltetrahydrofolate cyclo-ligase [Enemella evansiae]OYO06478.1 5-formyltetrahydrofolate cyclo-ligase [Enemella evansiae]OYO07774.1 5-formyltetrahydrofolate cyclo-ligase [Enemella evansiae]OYO08979.1 5-formyltetrahydrofolate cyclo-ligase [Enemella evansiae]